LPPGQAPEAALGRLVEAARHGDADAPAQLVRETWHGTYSLAYRLTGDEQDALDVTQETYLRALRALSRFRGDARFTTWLYRVTANCASDHVARRRRSIHASLGPGQALVADPVDERPDHDPEASASANDERALVAEALRRLPLRLRQVVVLRDIYDLPHKAIASELGISEAAAKVRLQRARKRLRADLGQCLLGPPGPRALGQGAHGCKGSGTVLTGPGGTGAAARLVVVIDDDAVAS